MDPTYIPPSRNPPDSAQTFNQTSHNVVRFYIYFLTIYIGFQAHFLLQMRPWERVVQLVPWLWQGSWRRRFEMLVTNFMCFIAWVLTNKLMIDHKIKMLLPLKLTERAKECGKTREREDAFQGNQQEIKVPRLLPSLHVHTAPQIRRGSPNREIHR